MLAGEGNSLPDNKTVANFECCSGKKMQRIMKTIGGWLSVEELKWLKF